MKKVVIIGGGFAGSFVAKGLEDKFQVTLIDSKDYFEFTPGVLRTIVDSRHMKKIQILHKDYLKKTKIIISHVSEIGKNYVKIKGKNLFFDYLAICSGSSYNSPFKEKGIVIATRAVNLKKSYQKLIKSEKVIIIGGGLVGVELAGDICTYYPNKEIKIIDAGDHLIQRNSEKAINYAENFFKKHNVEFLNNIKIIKQKGRNLITDDGEKLNADIVFLCTGIVPNFSFMKKNLKDKLDNKNHIIVNDFMQVREFENIFAAGDITNIAEEKTAQNAKRQAQIVVDNIIALENNSKLEKYTSKKTPLVISLGKYHGIFSWENIVLTGIIPNIMKMLIEKKEMVSIRN